MEGGLGVRRHGVAEDARGRARHTLAVQLAHREDVVLLTITWVGIRMMALSNT